MRQKIVVAIISSLIGATISWVGASFQFSGRIDQLENQVVELRQDVRDLRLAVLAHIDKQNGTSYQGAE